MKGDDKQMTLTSEILLAMKGKRIWKKIYRKNNLKDAVCIFLLDNDEELNMYAGMYADDIMIRAGKSRIVFISEKQAYCACAREKCPSGITVIVNPVELNAILKYWQLVKFSDYVYWVTLSKPDSNKVKIFLGVNGINRRDIVCLCCYKLRTIPRRIENVV